MKRLFLTIVIQAITLSSLAQSWHQVEIDTEVKLNAIDFPSSSVGYIGGDSSLLYKTIDGGENWNRINHNGLTTHPLNSISELQFISEDAGFAVTNSAAGSLFKTIDGGINWSAIDTMTNGFCFANSIYMFNENNGVFGGSGCFSGSIIERVENNEFTPTNVTIQSGVYQGITDIDFYDENNGIASSGSKYFYRTTDGGLTWDTIPTDLSSGLTTGVRYVSQDTLVGSFSSQIVSYGILVSTDGGLTWEQESSSATFSYPDYFCVGKDNSNHIFVGAKNPQSGKGMIFKSTSVIHSWSFEDVAEPIYDIDSYQEVTFAVGDSGLVLVNKDLTVGLDENVESVESHVSIYPNPTKDLIEVSANQMIEQLQLFDLSGKSVLTEPKIQSMQKSVDLSELPKGVYLIKLTTATDVIFDKVLKD